MEKELIITKTPLRRKYRSNHVSVNTLDLPIIIADLKQKHIWANGELKTKVLLKNPDKQIILTAMKESTEIDSFQANDSITFQIMEGKVRFHIRNESVTLGKGQLFTIHENIKYRFTTKEESVLLVTINGGIIQMSNN